MPKRLLLKSLPLKVPSPKLRRKRHLKSPPLKIPSLKLRRKRHLKSPPLKIPSPKLRRKRRLKSPPSRRVKSNRSGGWEEHFWLLWNRSATGV